MNIYFCRCFFEIWLSFTSGNGRVLVFNQHPVLVEQVDRISPENAKSRAFWERSGEVLEWLKRHAWKACIPQKGIEGSNPSLSAKRIFYFFRYSKSDL